MEEINRTGEGQITLQDVVSLVLKRKRIILWGTGIITLLTAVLSLLLPPAYQAETKFYPAQGGANTYSQILGQFSGMAPFLGGFSGLANPAEVQIEILKSRPVLDEVIKKFDLMKRYETEYMVDARKKLEKKMDISLDKKSSVISLAVRDGDPAMAAEMANFFIEELKEFGNGFALSEAAQRRIFFEQEVKKSKEQLKEAEIKVSSFQKRTGALKLDDQSRAVIEAIANLKAQIADKEVQLKVMGTYTTPRNPDFKKLKEALNGLKAELNSLETERNRSSDPFLPISRMPDIGTEYARTLRDLKFAETVYELMLKQYETARIEEAKEPFIIQVIEKAVPPEKRIFPKRASMTAIGFFVGLFLSVFAVFTLKALEPLRADKSGPTR